MGDLNELVAWLAERAKPDSGIVYGDNSRGIAEATFHGYDAAFVAERFHGKGAAVLAAALTSLMAERDDLAETAAKYRVVCNDRDSWRNACLEARTGCNQRSDVIRSLRRHLTAAEAQLKAAREVIEWASRQQRKPYGVTVAIDALSLDTNKGDDHGTR